MNVKTNNKGFSLVELMVVVAIIGMLAAVAVPQFSKFQAKSRQAEAKANLSALYVAQKSFNGEHGGYSANLRAAGFAPAGELLYNIGFTPGQCATWAACSPQFGVVAGAAPGMASNVSLNVADPTVCEPFNAAGGAIGVLGCRLRQATTAAGNIGPDTAAIPAGNTVTTLLFTALAQARIMEGAASPIDRWSINNNKQVALVQNGIN